MTNLTQYILEMHLTMQVKLQLGEYKTLILKIP